MRIPATLALSLVPVALCALAAGAAAPHRVVQQKRAFQPRAIEIARGDTLVFANEDDFLHHVYVKSPAFSFDSPEQEPGQSYAVQFTEAGTFEVLCAIHPKMRLAVTVK
jgi:plastocyanin